MSDVDFPTLAKWQAALLSTFLISTFPNMFLYLVPSSWLSTKKGSWFNFQHILLAFASGGLLGDVLLHAIPHLMSPHNHGEKEEIGDLASKISEGEDGVVNDFMASVEDEVQRQIEDGGGCNAHDTRSLVIGSLVLAGFLFFFTAERLLTTYLKHPHDHSHAHSHGNQLEVEVEGEADIEDTDYGTLTVKELKDICRERHLPITGRKSELVQRCVASAATVAVPAAPVLVSRSPIADHKTSAAAPAFYTTLSASGWLNISADFMHNFTDGLAMGASHASGDGKLALAATLSIFFHEVPHEIGDFTILIESGMSKNSAIKMQFFTSAGAFLGTVIGLLTSSLGGWDEYLIAVTSGGFLYVATVSLIPTILNKKQNQQGEEGDVLQVVLEGLFFALGVGMMVVVSLLEAGEGGHHH